jgi:UDP-N-acetylglucosamine 2-epimerase (non-hydrolysing)
MASVYKALAEADDFEPILVSTGQHREMLKQVLDIFGLSADVDFELMRRNQSLGSLTARLFEAFDGMLDDIQPDMVLVQGDTTSVMCGAISSFYRDIPVGHVEAGLRTGDLRAPFPEEANRVIASRVTSIHFAPTEGARANLLAEGIADGLIHVTGNTVIDSLLMEIQAQQQDTRVVDEIGTRMGVLLREAGASDAANLDDVPFILVTGHRRENFGRGFQDICDALLALANRYPDHRIIYPVHLNPNVRDVVHQRLGSSSNILLLPPVDYRLFVSLMSRCTIALTDSGGVQEEAPSLGKPVLVMRETTERPEGVEAGTVRLVGTDPERIETEIARLLDDEQAYSEMASRKNPYGDGHAAERIVAILRQELADCDEAPCA